jgi:hypothetical protein
LNKRKNFYHQSNKGKKLMSDDSYTEVTTESWWSRLKESLGTALLGLILFLVAFVLLFWNEGRAVHRAKILAEGAGIVISIDANKVDTANEGQLVHLTEEATTDKVLTDAMFALVAPKAIKLRRVVEMYQWQEERHTEKQEKLGGGTETVTTYTYTKTWKDSVIDASQFNQPKGHNNPSRMKVKGETFIAKPVKLGAFSLSSRLVENLNNYQHLPMTDENMAQVPEEVRAQFGEITEVVSLSEQPQKLHISYGNYYVGQDSLQPQLGDLRIKFEVVLPATISVVAKQLGSSLTTYTTQTGGSLELFEYGTITAQNMFKHEVQSNTMLTWILRFVGFIIMFFGLSLIFNVLKTLADMLPFLGDIVGFIGTLVSFVIAATLSLITIAIAWIFYRPVLGITLIVIAVALLYFLKSAKPQQRARKTSRRSTSRRSA